jgi:hypothetical protein
MVCKSHVMGLEISRNADGSSTVYNKCPILGLFIISPFQYQAAFFHSTLGCLQCDTLIKEHITSIGVDNNLLINNQCSINHLEVQSCKYHQANLCWPVPVLGLVTKGQSEPAPMTAPVSRSVHRMGRMIRLFFIHLFTLR